MPINDPIKGNKVAPASLAFEYGRASRRNSATSYQNEIRTTNEVTVVQTLLLMPRRYNSTWHKWAGL